MFLSTLQPSAAFASNHDHTGSFEKVAVETELRYLENFDTSGITVDTTGDFLVLEGVVRSSAEMAKVLRIAHDIVGFSRVLNRLVICPLTA